MASASSFQSPMIFRCLSGCRNQSPSFTHSRLNLIRPLHSSPRSVVVFARRRKDFIPASTKKKKKRSLPHKDNTEDDPGEDPLEALFSLLEEDLKNGNLSLDDDDDEEISEEDLAKLERELEEALGDDELLKAFLSPDDSEESEDNNKDADEEISEKDLAKLELELEQALADDDDINNKANAAIDEEKEEEEDDEEEEEEDEDEDDDDDDEQEEEETLNLKNWQVRRLAYALKNGRRKTSIKNLAADVCLDRAIVLKLLRDPPPQLLMLSAALPDKPAPVIAVTETRPVEMESSITTDDAEKPEVAAEVPVHVMQRGWSAQKRLKKVHLATLERVYSRTKRPTNSMINSIVHVTNLPRKKVVKWFEDKRTEEGVPEQRRPYQRSAPETVFN